MKNRPFDRGFKSSRRLIMLPLACSMLLTGCSGLGYTPPPGAKLGDAFLSLTISTSDRIRMPQGADIVISIENATATDEKQRTIVGDVVKLSQPDSDVKINFPIDRHRLSECGKIIPCQIHVKIVKDGSVRYHATKPEIYTAGQTKAKITVARP